MILLASKLPAATAPVLFYKKQLLAGHESFFRPQDPGLRYAAFETYRFKGGTASFLTDSPYDPYQRSAEQLQAAEGRLAPLLLNPDPVEHTALIFCSSSKIAMARMQATGYRPVAVLEDGKIIAEKQA